MNYPFYRKYYYPAREVPVPSRRETKPARKVIHVPVTDGSEKRSRSRMDSAVKIQKVFRGFMVRKNVKKIAAIKAEVDEMERRIMSEETVELIKKDRKERLKINEMLMRLLLKLDSVPGVDFGVRDCRKAVIRKAIRLQEAVDSIADESIDRKCDSSESDRNPNSGSNSNSNHVEFQNNGESEKNIESEAGDIPEAMDVEDRRIVEEENAPEIEVNVAKSASELTSNSNPPENDADQNRELQGEAPEIEGNVAKSASELNLNSDSNSLENDAVNQKLQLQKDVKSEKNFESEAGDTPEAMDVEPRRPLEEENAPEFEGDIAKSEPKSPEVDAAKSTSEPNLNPNSPEVDDDRSLKLQSDAPEVDFAESVPKSTSNSNPLEKTQPAANEYAESQTGSSADPDENEESDSENGEEIERDEGKGGDDGKNIQLLEKLVEDNEKMMGLMGDLFKKNEMQTQLLSSLSHRVEHLERALMCERFRTKKKKQKRNATNCS